MKTAYNSFLVPTSFVSTAVLNTTTKKFNNSQQTRHFSTKWSYLLWANIIFGILCLPIVNSGYVKRSQYCPYSGNNVIYCKPQQDDFFRINDIAIIAWNTNNVLFANSDTLNISLFRRDPSNTARSFEVSAFAFQVNKAEGSTNVSVVSYWFPDYLTNKSQPTTTITQSQRFINYTFYLHIKPSVNIPNLPEIPDSDDFIAQYDRLFVNASDPSAVSTTTTSLLAATASVQTSSPLPVVATSTPSTISEDNTNNGNKVPLPVIVSVIVVALVAALLAFIALVVATRAKKRDIRPGKTKNLSSLSTSSNTPMVQADRSIVSDNADNANFIGNVHKDIDSPVEEESSINSTATLATNKLNPKISFNNDATNNNTNNSSHNNRSNNNPISLLDAALISDAFRKVMRKPDWKHDEEYTDEEDYDANLSEDELIRRREAKKLMKKELAEEGTGIHSVSRRHTKVEHSSSIHGENDDDDDDDIEKRNSSDVKDNDRSDVISGFDSSIINIEPENK